MQIGTMMDLLFFMYEISNLITLCSKEFQKFYVLPFHVSIVYNQLKSHLVSAKKSFEFSNMTTVVNIKTRGGKDFSLWDLFSKTIETVKSERTFCDVKLMMPAERGRVTRSGSPYTLDRHGFEILLKDRYKNWDVCISSKIN